LPRQHNNTELALLHIIPSQLAGVDPYTWLKAEHYR